MSVDTGIKDPLQTPQRAGDCVFPLTEDLCTRLVATHGPMVKAACHRILRDEPLAEDAAQEVFLLLVRKLPSLKPQTILGGWLYVTACNLARSHSRDNARRRQRENQPEAADYLMKPTEDNFWRELEPLLDDAMLSLSQRQRDLVLFRYFQNHSQRAAATLVGCSESVASRDLGSAIEKLRRFFANRGVVVSGAGLVTLLTAHGAKASLGATAFAATLASASGLKMSTTGSAILLELMTLTTTSKIIGTAAAVLITLTVVYQVNRSEPTPQTSSNRQDAPTKSAPAPAISKSDNASESSPVPANPQALPSSIRSASLAKAKSSATYDEASLKAAREKVNKFMQRINQLALVSDPVKAQEQLLSEYGIRLSVERIRELQGLGQKGFSFGVIESWAANQPQEALSWAASIITASGTGVDFQQLFLDAARRSIPDLNRARLDEMLPDSPGKERMLDLAEATTEPLSLANRILTSADPSDRAARLRTLAQGWSNPEASAEWARQNLSGDDKTAFYSQVGYNLAHQNPQAALQVLSELQGTGTYASTFSSMMRGLVQEGGLGQQAADLIDNANVTPRERADLISELSRRWVRNNPDATINWVNSLTEPEDFRAAIPLLVSQLDNDRISRTVESYLKNHDPVMEHALIEAAAPQGLYFDPEKSRLILDPLINQDPNLKLRSSEDTSATLDGALWNSVNQTARRQAEVGSPTVAMDWLAKLPFATDDDYAQAISTVFNVWNVKSSAEANSWLQNSALNSSIKTSVEKAAAAPVPTASAR